MRHFEENRRGYAMKAIAILPAAAAAMLAFSVSMASSQEVCVKGFQACMDSCGTKPSKSMQDTCFSSCETKTNVCYEGVFGARPSGGAANVQPVAPAKDAMAKKEPRGRDQKRLQKQEPAPEPQEQASEQEQAPAR
jgi:hypothetical protein